MSVLRLVLLSLFLGLFGGSSSFGAELRLTGLLNSEMSAVSQAILRKAYARLGYDLVVDLHPGRRSLQLSSTGQRDGELMRIKKITSAFPTLKPTSIPLAFLEASPWSMAQDISITRWEDLKPYRIGIVRGVHILEKNTAGMERYQAKDVPALLELMSKGRLDVIIGSDTLVDYLAKTQYGKIKIHKVGAPLLHVPLYHFLHQGKADLLPSLNKVLEEMDASGEMVAIREQAYKHFFDSAYRDYQLKRCAELAGC